MINLIRSAIGSWVIKILFALLIASFAVWGIGDIFRGQGLDQRVGSVGDRQITLLEIDRVFQDQLDNLRQNLDPTIEPQTAIMLGALDAATQQVVAGALIDEAADDLGLRASDEAIARAVAENPSLQGIDGRFDARIFRSVLAANGMTEEEYLELSRRDTARQQVLTAAAGPLAAPDPLIEAIYAFQNERRSARYVRVNAADQTDVPQPTDADIEAYFEENAEAYRAPEYRRLAILTLGPDNLLEEVSVDEAQVRDLYERRRDQYVRAERRNFRQVIVQDEALAARIAEEGQSTGSLDAALEAVGGDLPATVALDGVARDGMLTEELGAAAFALEAGSVGAPIQSPFGWHVFEVVEALPGGVTPFEEARPELEQELERQAAGDAVYEVANQVMDERAGGASIDEVASSFNLQVLRPEPVDRQGQSEAGTPVAGLPYTEALLNEAFLLEPGDDGLLQEQPDGGYFAVAVEEIIEPRDRALDEVREEARASVLAAARAAAATEKAETLEAQLGEGRTLEAVAAGAGLEIAEADGFLRTDPGTEGLPASAIEGLFGVEIGVAVRAEGPEGEVVAVLTEVTPAGGAGAAAVRARVADQLAAMLRTELNDQLSNALATEYPVDVNRDQLMRFYTNDQLGG